jgi:hypothetical protein
MMRFLFGKFASWQALPRPMLALRRVVILERNSRITHEIPYPYIKGSLLLQKSGAQAKRNQLGQPLWSTGFGQRFGGPVRSEMGTQPSELGAALNVRS